MPAGRLESEEVVEGGDAVGLAKGNAERLGDKAERGLVEITEGFLNSVESFDEGVAGETVAAHGAVDDAPAFVVGRKRGFFQGKGHGRSPEAGSNEGLVQADRGEKSRP